MKTVFTTLTMVLALGTTSIAFAKSDQALMKEAAKNQVTIAKAKTLKDETGVTLKGTIVRQVMGDEFELKDATGMISIDVDDEMWQPMQLKAGDRVKVMGEVDTHRSKATAIEVIKIERMK